MAKYNTSIRVGFASLPGGISEKVWFECDGKRAALPSREIHVDVRDILSVGYTIDEITAEYFRITMNVSSDITYSAIHKS